MGPAADQRPTVKCPQGHLNPAGRQFCQTCGRRIVASAQPVESTPEPHPPDETQRLTSLLATSQQDNQRLQEELAGLRKEIETARANTAPAPPHGVIAELAAKLKDAEQRAEPQLLEWKQRWNSAVEKIGALENSLAASTRELEAHKAQLANPQQEGQTGPAPGSAKQSGQATSKRGIMLVGSLMTILGGAGGFGIDRMMLPSQTQVQATISELKTQLSGQSTTIQKLNTQLDSVTHEAAGFVADLSTAKTDLSAAKTALKKAEADRNETAAGARQSEAAASRLPALLARYPGAKIPENTQGILRWEGEIKTDKGVNVVIDRGVALIASRDGTSSGVSGQALPGVPVVVEPVSQNVYVLEPPRKDQWGRVVFHIDKKGHASVQLRWTVL
jgi:hypothetical protein